METQLESILGQKFGNGNFEYWVYGLGTSGRLIVDLCRQRHCPVSGIIVGNGYKTEDSYKDIEIYEIDEVEKRDKVILFYTVKQEELLHDLKEYFHNSKWNETDIVDISSKECYMQMLHIYYQGYFRDKNLETQIENENILKLKGCICLNPKSINMDYMFDIFLSEIGDLVLPPIFFDYDRIDEGSYENGPVKIEKDDVVIDCGANIGLFSAIAAWRSGRVYAFEPVEEIFQYLETQAGFYPENIYPIKKALSNFCGTDEMYIGEEEHMTENSLYNENGFSRKEIIECITLDQFIEENGIGKVDFIKADIEGAERQMLLGAKKVLAEYAPKLSICTYHREDDKEVLSNIILEANPNYKIIYKWKKLYAYVEGK